MSTRSCGRVTSSIASSFIASRWPSVATGNSLSFGPLLGGEPLTILSNMNDGGVIFADGMEQDHIDFTWGRTVSLTVAAKTLNLVRAD